MKFISTRNKNIVVSGAQAIAYGISEDGGLFVPAEFPVLKDDDFIKLEEMDYPERAAYVLNKYLDEFSFSELKDMCQKAYSSFDEEGPAPVSKIDDSLYLLELWHGPTCAFKDLALQLLPYLLVESKKKIGLSEETLILVATSGDTGKAALEGFKDVEGTKIMVFYPADGVSNMQRLQMVTQKGGNVKVIGIKGNFDDAQSAVKKVFTDESVIELLKNSGITMSSANSINFGRLAPQIAYYVSSYVDLVSSGEIKKGDKINFVVPTGNFGNILAAYYAFKMGIPINKLIVASNSNKILSDFFNTGEYDIKRQFYKTISPSMDILISSNLERFIFEIVGRDDEKVRELYLNLKENGVFKLDKKLLDESIFLAGWADEEETKEAIASYFDLYDYALDTHTAVAASVHTDYATETGDNTPCVIVSTASPYKFPLDVYNAINGTDKKMDAFKAVNLLEMTIALDAPENIKNLKEQKVIHGDIIEPADIKKKVLEFANVQG